MDFPKKYWWLVLVVVPILVALINKWPPVIFESRNEVPQQQSKHSEIPPLSPQEKKLYDQATMLWKDGVYTDALNELNKLISVRRDYVNAYIIRGRIYLENLKDYQNALQDFRKVLQMEPDNKYALYDLGLTYYHLGDLSQAIDWNDSAQAQDPDLIIAIYNHAIYHVDYGEKYKDNIYYFRAIELYENVIGRGREFAVSAMFNLAALYARLAKQEKDKITKDRYVKKAVELLDRAIEKEGPERFKKVTGEISVLYGEDLKAIYQEPAYQRMIEEWKQKFH